MDALPWIILGLEGFIFLGIFILVIFLGIRAYNKRQEEDFEEREN